MKSSNLTALLSVAGFTLLSRATGFFRDICIGTVLGTGPLADAFVVAFRLPNQFRAIFGEGAFSSAYVPAYSATLAREGLKAASIFAGYILTLLLASQIVLLILAFIATRELVVLMAPGFDARVEVLEHAIFYTRITFPYLLCMTLVTLHSGTLNAHARFAASAGAPILLNLCMMASLYFGSRFSDYGEALSWGVSVSGVLQFLLVFGDAALHNIAERPQWPRLTPAVRQFFRALGPAILGAAGSQIAIFADTIIASFLPAGSVAALYYADRLYQLPLGILGIAAGTVLLPSMSKFLAEGNIAQAQRAQNRMLALVFVFAAPFVLAFVLMSVSIMRGIFLRGAFLETDARLSAAVLAAYGCGLLPMVLLRAVVSSFQARGDTKTPMLVFLVALAGNLVLKFSITPHFGIAGLAFATAVGAWLNFGGLVFLGIRRAWFHPDKSLGIVVCVATIASLISLLAISATAPLRHAVGQGILATFHGGNAIITAPLIELALSASVLFLFYGACTALALRLVKRDYPLMRDKT